MSTKIIILAPYEPEEELIHLLEDPAYVDRVQFIKGTVISYRSMSKAKAGHAEACFLLASKFGTDGDLEKIDCNTVLRYFKANLRAHAVKRYFPNLPLFVQVLHARNLVQFQNLADHIISTEAYKMVLFY